MVILELQRFDSRINKFLFYSSHLPMSNLTMECLKRRSEFAIVKIS
jgi:hypothetical protein